MKKQALWMLALSMCLLSACSGGYLTVHQGMGDRLVLTETAEDLPEAADLIVVFVPQKQENVVASYSDGNAASGYTKTTGRVDTVLSGDVAEGDVICVTEECYTTALGTVLWTQGGYLPMESGESYLLFLKAYGEGSAYEGMYFPVDLEYGKYVLPAAGKGNAETASALQVGDGVDLDDYIQWYHEVAALYPELWED